MSQQYDNTNTGIISKNDRKESDKHPDIKGSANIDGVEFYVNGWRKERKDGSGSFYSLSFKRKEEGTPSRPTRQQPTQTDDLDIPF